MFVLNGLQSDTFEAIWSISACDLKIHCLHPAVQIPLALCWTWGECLRLITSVLKFPLSDLLWWTDICVCVRDGDCAVGHRHELKAPSLWTALWDTVSIQSSSPHSHLWPVLSTDQQHMLFAVPHKNTWPHKHLREASFPFYFVKQPTAQKVCLCVCDEFRLRACCCFECDDYNGGGSEVLKAECHGCCPVGWSRWTSSSWNGCTRRWTSSLWSPKQTHSPQKSANSSRSR